MKKIGIALLVLLLIGMNAFAQTLSRNETVYVTLNATGTPVNTEVVTWLRTDGSGPAEDRADLKGVKNIRGKETPAVNNGKIVFATPARDIFYRGTTSKTLPVGVDIRYRLNGRAITAEALNGRSGKLQMDIRLTNRTTTSKPVTYIEIGTRRSRVAREEVAVPFIVMVAMDLDIDRFNNVTAPEGAFAVVGRTMKMQWMAFPYPATTLRLEADCDKVKLPSILFTMIPKFPPLPEIEIEEKLNQIYGGVDQVGGYLVRLEDGARQLNDGQKQMLSALEQVNDGTGKLIQASNAQVEIIGGAVKINEGMAAKITPLTKIPLVSGEAGKAKHYLDIQKELLDLAATGGPFSEEILAFLKEQGKDAPPVKEFPGIRVTTDGIAKLNAGSKEMIAGAHKLDDGSRELATAIGQVKTQGTDVIKQGIVSGADPLVRKLAAIRTAKRLAANYDHFAGRPSGVKSSVEFIMKTPGE